MNYRHQIDFKFLDPRTEIQLKPQGLSPLPSNASPATLDCLESRLEAGIDRVLQAVEGAAGLALGQTNETYSLLHSAGNKEMVSLMFPFPHSLEKADNK